MAEGAKAPAIFTIPVHRSFADSLVAGILRDHGRDPLVLARGRILLPNNRAVRSLTEAFVRASGGGLLLPRLVAIGDPELDDRIGGALDPLDLDQDIPPAIGALERQAMMASMLADDCGGAAEAMRLASGLARAIDALEIEEVDPARLREVAADAPELAGHWDKALARFENLARQWPDRLAQRGLIDLATRRGILLRAMARRWSERPPAGFTIAAGITTAAPAVAALLEAIARMPEGAVVLPGLALDDMMPDAEWEALGPGDDQKGEQSHPQYHLKLLLDRVGIARAEVRPWRGGGRAASTALRARAVANAMSAPEYTDKWAALPARERRLTGIRAVELPDPASEAQAIAIALREALEMPGQTAALVTPDRQLAERVSAQLQRWGIAADDSAGQPLSRTTAGTLLLAIAAAVEEQFAPVPLLSLLKHPSVGGEGDARGRWLDQVRKLDRALRGPRPGAGLAGLDRKLATHSAWTALRPSLEAVTQSFAQPATLAALGTSLRSAADAIAGDLAWRGAAGRATAELLTEIENSPAAATLALGPGDAAALLRALLDERAVRRPYGGHPRLFIWGLLEARLQHADLMVLGGLNEGVWPPPMQPDSWLPPAIRRRLGLAGLDARSGLAAHDFASALGAPRVLISRARRDSRSPTIASRLWLRLEAMTGGVTRDIRLERLALALDDPGRFAPADRPRPSPPSAARPRKIAVTALDRLKADPFAFYARAILRLPALEPVDAEHTAAWKGSAVHRILDAWFKEDGCDPARLLPRARELIAGEDIHPMLRALWAPRLEEAVGWLGEAIAEDRAEGRRPLMAEVDGEADVGGVLLHGRVDRIDRLSDGGLAIVDYKTGKAPSGKAVAEGFALQLGLLGLIAERGGFPGLSGEAQVFEYWSLAKDKDRFGKRSHADKGMAEGDFLAHAARNFAEAAAKWLTGEEPFVARLNPAHAPYGEYDQLMRLDEWYGREGDS